MNYFDDIQFVEGQAIDRCVAVMDRSFPMTYSIEYMSAGRMFYGVDKGPQRVIDRPILFWHNPGHSYQYGAVDERGWDHHWILMKGDRAQRIVERGLMPLAADCCLIVPEPSVVDDVMHQLVAAVILPDRRRHCDAVVLLERLVAMTIDWSTAGQMPEPYREAVELVAARIHRDPTAPVEFREEARAGGLSYSHFRRLFRQQIGKPPHEYLLSCRMQYAARMLRENRQVKDVAYEIGYDDPAQFSKLFKNKIGLSPQQYRAAIPRGGRC